MITEKIDWRSMALECLKALKLMHAHYFDDLAKRNPGFLGRLCLQNYGLMNEAFMAERAALAKYGNVQGNERAPIVSVVLEGGLVVQAFSEIPVQIMVIDKDVEGGDLDEIATLMDWNGQEFQAMSSMWGSEVLPEYCIENAKRLKDISISEEAVDDGV